MAYATPADIEARLGRPLDDSESQIVQTRLQDAELLIKSRISDLDEKIASGAINKEVVVMVESDMVLRLVKNPEGYTQESDGAYSYTISVQVASGRLSVLPEEWALLGIRSTIYTIRPYVDIPTATYPDVWRTI